jgi:hypothetical protein
MHAQSGQAGPEADESLLRPPWAETPDETDADRPGRVRPVRGRWDGRTSQHCLPRSVPEALARALLSTQGAGAVDAA